MSNLGFQAVYRVLNSRPEAVCERVFLPAESELRQLQKTGSPLMSHESRSPIGSFHIIAFSLSFENDYPNILTMLALGNIPLLQRDRPERSPLVIAGGVSMFLNPEPLADFFDLIVIGEGEELLPEFLELVCSHGTGRRWKRPALSDFAKIEGIYVPSAYATGYDENGLITSFIPETGFPQEITCRQVKALDRFAASSCIRTPDTEFSDMTLLEVSRGCPRQCRFCAVGSVYKPFRPRTLEGILEELKNVPAGYLKVGILGAAVSDYPGLPKLMQTIVASGGFASVSSLRADALSQEMVELLQQCGHKTFTLAPEAGSQRLRTAIAKNLSDDELFRAVRILARYKIPNIKLYFMIGLPTETEHDVQEIVRLVKEIKHFYFKEAKSEKWLNHIQLSVSPFVPKPCTPFQWHPFEEVAGLKQKIRLITGALKKERKVAVSYDLPKWGYVQTLLSRGDRRVGRLLIKAFERDGDWTAAFRESDINPDFYVYRHRTYEERLPWDFIRHAVSKKRLWEEYQKALGRRGEKSLR